MIYSLIQVGTKVGMGSIGATLGQSESLYYNYYLIEKSEQKSLALNAVIAISISWCSWDV